MDDENPPLYVPDENGPELPLPPALPSQPYNDQEAIMLLEEITDIFSNPHAALEELMACGCTVFEDVEELLDGALTGDQFAVLLPMLIQISFAFAPPGTLQPELNLDEMEASLARLMDTEIALPMMIAASLQPHMLDVVLARFDDFNTNIAPRKDRLGPNLLPLAHAVFRVVVDAFDKALRLEEATRGE